MLIPEGAPIARRVWESRLGLAVGELDQIVTDAIGPGWVGGRSEAEIHRRLSEVTGLVRSEADDLLEDFYSNAYLDPTLSAFIRTVRSRFKVATLPNAAPGNRQAMTDKFAFDQLVDLMVISAEEGIEKPDPAIYLLTAERLGVEPTGCVFVDDRLDNVEGATAVGMTAFVHAHSPATLDRLLELTVGNNDAG